VNVVCNIKTLTCFLNPVETVLSFSLFTVYKLMCVKIYGMVIGTIMIYNTVSVFSVLILSMQLCKQECLQMAC